MRSSTWSKWDLHIHSPGSFYWKGSKKLNKMNLDEIKTEMSQFIETVNQNEVEVFCLMDYWNYDWYLQLKEYVRDNPTELKKTIFPGIELRVECPVNYRLNIHCIFSDKLSRQQLIDFKSELYISSINKKLSNDSIIEFAKKLDESKARVHGYCNPEELEDDQLLELGSKTVEITRESLRKAFQQIPNNSGYIILPYDTSDGLLKLDWEKQPHADIYFMQSAQIFESRDPKNIDLISGVRTEENDKIFDNFHKTLGNINKPCISGSDAHRYSDYGKFPSDRITWIKALPSFEGLKQIIFDPQDRVKIQLEKPEQKKPYYTIKEVRFIENSGKNLFDNSPITFNQNLNTIIGGKSTGKSLLLYHIAKTIDEDLIDKLIDNEVIKKYDLEDEATFDFEVTWQSGDKNLLSNPNDKRKIIYIPQSYLSKLSDNSFQNRKTLNDFIKNLLLEDEYLLHIYQSRVREQQDINNDIQRDCRALAQEIEEKKNIGYKLKEVGNPKGLIDYIKTLTEEINKLKKSSGLTEPEIKKYDELVASGKGSRLLQAYLKSDKENIDEFQRKITNIIESIDTLIEEHSNRFEIKTVKEGFIKEYSFLLELKAKTIAAYNNLLGNGSRHKSELDKVQKQLNSTISEIKPLLGKVKLKDQINQKEELIKKENQKLNEIRRLIKDDKEKSKSIDAIIKRIKSKYKELRDSYLVLTSELSISVSDPDLAINVKYDFDSEGFNTDLSKNIYKQNLKSNYSSYNIDTGDGFTYDYNPREHLQFTNQLIDDIISGKAKQFKNSDLTSVLIDTLKNNYFIDFGLTYKQDVLSKMSPGKKNLALLKILIELSIEEWPILIDQPEDELDNRSIYTDLVKFLRNKKKLRQIITVSHNPNVVVSADAENVVIANQKGQEKDAENVKFQFEYKTGALENLTKDVSSTALLQRMTIKEHVCQILEGGKEAFEKREQKYDFK